MEKEGGASYSPHIHNLCTIFSYAYLPSWSSGMWHDESYGLRSKRTIIIGRDTRVRRRQRQRPDPVWGSILLRIHTVVQLVYLNLKVVHAYGELGYGVFNNMCDVCAKGRAEVGIRTIFNSVRNTQRGFNLKSENTGCYHRHTAYRALKYCRSDSCTCLYKKCLVLYLFIPKFNTLQGLAFSHIEMSLTELQLV